MYRSVETGVTRRRFKSPPVVKHRVNNITRRNCHTGFREQRVSAAASPEPLVSINVTAVTHDRHEILHCNLLEPGDWLHTEQRLRYDPKTQPINQSKNTAESNRCLGHVHDLQNTLKSSIRHRVIRLTTSLDAAAANPTLGRRSFHRAGCVCALYLSRVDGGGSKRLATGTCR